MLAEDDCRCQTGLAKADKVDAVVGAQCEESKNAIRCYASTHLHRLQTNARGWTIGQSRDIKEGAIAESTETVIQRLARHERGGSVTGSSSSSSRR